MVYRVFVKGILSTTSTTQLHQALQNQGLGQGLQDVRIPRKGHLVNMATTTYCFLTYETLEQCTVVAMPSTETGLETSQQVDLVPHWPKTETTKRTQRPDLDLVVIRRVLVVWFSEKQDVEMVLLLFQQEESL